MEDKKKTLYLYEALELRSEYDARIKTLKDCLPESKQNKVRFSFGHDDGKYRASADFDLASARKDLRKMELKRRKLNSAVQRANFNHVIDFNGEALNLSEALETRKALNEQIGEFHNQVVASSCQKVIYKECRDIVEDSEISYADAVKNLEQTRLAFRELNRKLRLASFQTSVDYQDE